MTGGELVAAAKERMEPFWSVTRSQVYRELPGLAEAGYVRPGKLGPRAAQPYTVTAAGKRAFRAWLAEEPGADHSRNPLVLRVSFGVHHQPGAVAKLVHNCSSFAIRAVLAETFAMGVKAGVEPLALWKAVRQGATGRRRTFDGLMDKFLPGVYDPPSFALRLGHKDVSLATTVGREVGVPMRLANMVLEELTEALNRGWGDKDSSTYMLLEAERAGLEFKVPPAQLKDVIDQDRG